MKKNIVFISVLIIHVVSCAQDYKNRMIHGEENAKHEVIKSVGEKEYKPFYDTLLKTKETAIAVAEPILFSIYGKKNITRQKPYECYLIDGYWYISGTLPKSWMGGVFEIIFSSKDGRVIKLTHGK